MPDDTTNKGQRNQYDKILKENLEVTLPVIIREVLGIEVAESEELPDDMYLCTVMQQYTTTI